jgi:hypothetical protein
MCFLATTGLEANLSLNVLIVSWIEHVSTPVSLGIQKIPEIQLLFLYDSGMVCIMLYHTVLYTLVSLLVHAVL